MEVLVLAALLGLGTGFHCILMCGPLAMALPFGRVPVGSRLPLRLTFVAGRLLIYLFMGLLVGLVGRPVNWADQQLAFGISILIAGFFWFVGGYLNAFKKWRSTFQKAGIELVADRPFLAFLLLGFANGLLPCGAVYAALALASAMPGVWGAFLVMLVFGLSSNWWQAIFVLGIKLPASIGLHLNRFSRSQFLLAIAFAFLVFRYLSFYTDFQSWVGLKSPHTPKEAIHCRKI